MKVYLRICLTTFLVLTLVATSQGMSVARGLPGPSGQMILCTGFGPVTVFTDRNGTPVDPPAYCPDCALAQMVTLTTLALVLTLEPIATAMIFPRPNDAAVYSNRHTPANARAPPRVV